MSASSSSSAAQNMAANPNTVPQPKSVGAMDAAKLPVASIAQASLKPASSSMGATPNPSAVAKPIVAGSSAVSQSAAAGLPVAVAAPELPVATVMTAGGREWPAPTKTGAQCVNCLKQKDRTFCSQHDTLSSDGKQIVKKRRAHRRAGTPATCPVCNRTFSHAPAIAMHIRACRAKAAKPPAANSSQSGVSLPFKPIRRERDAANGIGHIKDPLKDESGANAGGAPPARVPTVTAEVRAQHARKKAQHLAAQAAMAAQAAAQAEAEAVEAERLARVARATKVVVHPSADVKVVQAEDKLLAAAMAQAAVALDEDQHDKGGKDGSDKAVGSEAAMQLPATAAAVPAAAGHPQSAVAAVAAAHPATFAVSAMAAVERPAAATLADDDQMETLIAALPKASHVSHI